METIIEVLRNIPHYEKTNSMDEKDFVFVNTKLQKCFTDLRINKITKFLDLQPIPYEDYLSMSEEYEGEILPIKFTCTFLSSFFPMIEQDFINKLSIMSLANFPEHRFVTGEKLFEQADTKDYRSLTLASNELEREIKARIKLNKPFSPYEPYVEVITQWFLTPYEVASSISEIRLDVVLALM